MCSNLRSNSRCFSIKIWAFPWEMFGSLNYPICSCWYSRDFYFFHSVSGKIRIQFLAKMKGVVRENWRLAHILNIKQANCKEETFLPLRARRLLSHPFSFYHLVLRLFDTLSAVPAFSFILWQNGCLLYSTAFKRTSNLVHHSPNQRKKLIVFYYIVLCLYQKCTLLTTRNKR